MEPSEYQKLQHLLGGLTSAEYSYARDAISRAGLGKILGMAGIAAGPEEGSVKRQAAWLETTQQQLIKDKSAFASAVRQLLGR